MDHSEKEAIRKAADRAFAKFRLSPAWELLDAITTEVITELEKRRAQTSAKGTEA